MRNGSLRLLLIVSLAMNLGVLGVAAYRVRGRETSAGAAPVTGPTLRDELRLTAGQARAFEAVRARLHPRVQALRQRMHERRRAYFTLLSAPSPDSAAMEGLLADMNGIQLEMQRAAADYLVAEARLLAPDQRALFARVMAREPATQSRQLPLLGPGGARLPDEPR